MQSHGADVAIIQGFWKKFREYELGKATKLVLFSMLMLDIFDRRRDGQ